MASFAYKAMTKDGRRVAGTIEASDRRGAVAQLQRSGQTPLSIEEVSDWVGFESSAYFRRVFRSLVGCSPRDYRRQERV